MYLTDFAVVIVVFCNAEHLLKLYYSICSFKYNTIDTFKVEGWQSTHPRSLKQAAEMGVNISFMRAAKLHSEAPKPVFCQTSQT